MTKQHGGYRTIEHDGIKVLECVVCGFAHLIDVPDGADLQKHYAETEYTEEWLAKEDRERDYWNWFYRERIRQIMRLIDKPGFLLDVGCGQGLFMEAAKSRGWQVTGIEPSTLAARKATERGLSVTLGFFPDDKALRQAFQAIHLGMVLEHVSDPEAVLLAAYNCLASRGVLCIEVPNDDSPLQKRVEARHGRWWINPRHINYFTPSMLRDLVLRCRFIPEWIEGTYPMEWFLLAGMDYVSNAGIGQYCHEWRMKWERSVSESVNLLGPSGLYRMLMEKYGMGRHIVLYAIKGS